VTRSSNGGDKLVNAVIGRSEGEIPLGMYDVDGRTILKRIFMNQGMIFKLDLFD
jgi:hypothetical protein